MIKLLSLKSSVKGLSLRVGDNGHKAEILYIVADVSNQFVVPYEWGYKDLVTSQVFNGYRGVYCGRYEYVTA